MNEVEWFRITLPNKIYLIKCPYCGDSYEVYEDTTVKKCNGCGYAIPVEKFICSEREERNTEKKVKHISNEEIKSIPDSQKILMKDGQFMPFMDNYNLLNPIINQLAPVKKRMKTKSPFVERCEAFNKGMMQFLAIWAVIIAILFLYITIFKPF